MNLGAIPTNQRPILSNRRPDGRPAELRRRPLDAAGTETLKAINNLGTLLVRSGDIEGAVSLFRETLDIRRKALGDDHPDTLMSVCNLSQLLYRSARLDEALDLGRQALEGRQRVLGGDHPDTVMAMGSLGFILEAKGEKATALGYLEGARAGQLAALGPDHWITLETTVRVVNLLVDLERPGEALALLDGIEQDARRVFTEGHRPRLGSLLTTRGWSRTALGELAAAERDLQEAVEVLGEASPADKRGKRLLAALVGLYERWHTDQPTGGYDAKAAEWLARRDGAAPAA